MKNLFCGLELKEDMTEEDVKKAEQCMECAGRMIKDLIEWQADWEENGIDYSQIDASAKTDIGLIGVKAWLRARREKLEEFKKEYEEAKIKIKKSKENLKKKQKKKPA